MRQSRKTYALITLGIVIFAALAGFLYLSAQRLESVAREQGLAATRDAIRRAVVQCYAVEGRYPESIAYLESRYGLYVDHSQYTVFYQVPISNHMPKISVENWADLTRE